MRTPRARGRIVLCASSSRSSFPVRPSSVSFLSSSPEAEEGKGGRGTGCRDAMRGFLADGGNYIGTLPTRVEESGGGAAGLSGERRTGRGENAHALPPHAQALQETRPRFSCSFKFIWMLWMPNGLSKYGSSCSFLWHCKKWVRLPFPRRKVKAGTSSRTELE